MDGWMDNKSCIYIRVIRQYNIKNSDFMQKQLKEVPTKTTNDKNTQTHTAVLPDILTVRRPSET